MKSKMFNHVLAVSEGDEEIAKLTDKLTRRNLEEYDYLFRPMLIKFDEQVCLERKTAVALAYWNLSGHALAMVIHSLFMIAFLNMAFLFAAKQNIPYTAMMSLCTMLISHMAMRFFHSMPVTVFKLISRTNKILKQQKKETTA